MGIYSLIIDNFKTVLIHYAVKLANVLELLGIAYRQWMLLPPVKDLQLISMKEPYFCLLK